MTLEEAIEKMKYMANSGYEMADAYHTDEGVYIGEEMHYRQSADDYMQIAEFLKELEQIKEQKE